MNLAPTSVSEALNIVGEKLGLSVASDRDEVLVYLNRIRSLWYSSFHRIRLFDDWLECFCVQNLCLDCAGNCCPCYQGISLPPHLTGPVSAWVAKRPVDLRSRWYEKDNGRDTSGPGLNMIELPGEFATSVDLTGAFKIRVLGESSSDGGSKVSFSATNNDNERVNVSLTIESGAWVQTDGWFRAIHSIALPSSRKGAITIAGLDENDKVTEVDVHQPSDPFVPSFRRYRITSPCQNLCTVYVQASRRYRDLCNDDDIVEIGDRLVLEHGASYFKYSENTTDPRELQRADRDLAMMSELIRGMIARERGGHVRDGSVAIKGRRTKKARLPGYNR